MIDLKAIKEKAGNALVKAGEGIKELDMGVAYTKMEDALSAVKLGDAKQKIIDFMDSPKMDSIKGTCRTVKDFLGFVPNYAQSVPGMIKDGLEKLKK